MNNSLIAKEAFDFLENLAQNNTKEWFSEHKSTFKKHEADVKSFYQHLQELLNTHDEIEKMKMFRIYRDVRFSKDQRPYKEHAACQFRHQDGRDAHAPGYYIHLGDDSVRFGGGIWMPPAPKLAAQASSLPKITCVSGAFVNLNRRLSKKTAPAMTA
mgnify:CR=1 FL=1